MVIFNSYVKLPEDKNHQISHPFGGFPSWPALDPLKIDPAKCRNLFHSSAYQRRLDVMSMDFSKAGGFKDYG